jgi:hypothetical protein
LNLLQAFRAIRAHGGTIAAVQSRSGARFTIELPAVNVEHAMAESQPRGRRAIVVAKDSAIVRLIIAILEAHGLVALALPSWEAALASASTQAADILVVDQGSFPPSFGSPQAPPVEAVPVVMIRERHGAAVDWPGWLVRYLNRPFTAEELVAVVESQLRET